MKFNFTILAILFIALSTSVTSCKKTQCGYCSVSCPNSQGIYTTSNGSTICTDDGGVQAAYTNGVQSCSSLNQGSGGCTTKWVETK